MNALYKRAYRLIVYTLLVFSFSAGISQEEASLSGNGNKVLKKLAIKASQGVAVDRKYIYAISNTKILKCDKGTGKIIATWQADKKQKGFEHFLHMNSGTVVDGSLYCAHSRYGIDPDDCTVEIWNVEDELLKHEKTIRLPRKYGSLTWIDRDSIGDWWMCYAVYGEKVNKDTKLVKYQYKDNKFTEVACWSFPEQVISNWGNMSCSGGSWGPDGCLYTTGHDGSDAYVVKFDKNNKLKFVRTEKDLGFFGQAIAWDRFSERPLLWGIKRNKDISVTLIPEKVSKPH